MAGKRTSDRDSVNSTSLVAPSTPPSSSQVILHDPSKQKIVLYDPSSQQITLCQGRWYHHNNDQQPINLSSYFQSQAQFNDRYYQNQGRSSPFFTNPYSFNRSTSNSPQCPMCHQQLPSIYQSFSNYNNHNHSQNNNNNNILNHMHRDYFMILDRSHATDSRRSTDSYSNNDTQQKDEIQPLSEDALNSGYYSRFFQKVKKLGSGSYGTVHLVKHVMHDISLGYFAIKIICVGDQLPRLVEILRYVLYTIMSSLHSLYI